MSGAAVVGEAEEGRAGAWPRPAGPQSGPAARRGEGGLAQATAPLPVAAVVGSASGPPRTAPAEPDAPAGAPGGLRWPDVLGKVLLQGGGAVGTEEALAEKEAVALLFAAKWCPGCRSFVPQLASSYDSALKEKGLAIVFVSSDHTEEEFDLFSGDMPWLALPFRERELARSLHRRFGVAGLPKLVILSGGGKLVSQDGRRFIETDPLGIEVPWRIQEDGDFVIHRRTTKENMFIHRTQGWSLMALGFCIQVLCCWWIPVMFFLSVVNFTTFCETRLRTWMVVFAVLILAIPLTIQCLNVSCAKLGYRFGYVVVSKCSWVAGAALLGYFIYGLYLYENSTYVMCYDGTGLNPLAIMRALWILSFCFLTLLGIGMACICCSRGPRLEG